jgi:starvation-inducible DNA-binding protein
MSIRLPETEVAGFVAATTSLPAFPAGEKSTSEVVRLITLRLHATTAAIRAVRDDVDAEDPATSDILHALLDGLEKQAWMIAAAA